MRWRRSAAKRRARGNISSPLSRSPARCVWACISSSRSLNAGEDPRYHALAVEWGADFPRRLFWFLQIQAACAFLLSLAVFLAARNPVAFPAPTELPARSFSSRRSLGEAWSDATLARFRATRGPGKKRLHGRAMGVVAASQLLLPVAELGRLRRRRDRLHAARWPQGWLALLAPAFMYWLLAHVSGVPPLEKHMLASRGDAFRAYQARVNVFFPGPQKRA